MSAKAGVAREVQSRPTRAWGWQDRASCRGESLELFFGPGAERAREKDARERKAKAICAQCPALDACRDYSLSRPEGFGLWAGLTEEERASERRRQMRSAATQAARAKEAAEKEQARLAKEARRAEAAKRPTGASNQPNPERDLMLLRVSEDLIAGGGTLANAARKMKMNPSTLALARRRARKRLAGVS